MLLKSLIPQISSLIPYEYAKIQNPQYEQIINTMLAAAQPVQAPHFIHTLGIPGAGKSSFCKWQNRPDYMFVGFDAIMEQIPAYHDDIKNLGSVIAFKNWEIPARIIGYELLCRAIEKRCNIFFEHSGATAAHLDLLTNLHRCGYKIEIDYIRCDLDKALLRARQRELLTGRHTPPELIRQRAQILSSLCIEYKKIADVFKTYDNSFESFILQDETSEVSVSAVA